MRNPEPVCVVHDYFAIKGGGERLSLELCRYLDAELLVGYSDTDSYDLPGYAERAIELGLPRPFRHSGIRTLALAVLFSSRRARLQEKRIRIFSGVVSPFAALEPSLPGVNIFYCHTPPRFLYDQKAFFLSRGGPLRRLGMALVGPWFQRGYERAVSRMHVIVANSENIRRRIKTHLGRDSIVVYPPIDTEGFRWGEPQGYYLSMARLTPLKRVATIVDAFRAMPDRQLIVASGGDQEAELRARAAGAPNIRFTGWTEEAELRRLVAGAIATIYIPVEEDFGMSPVESMAAGKPVIGVAEGGLLETVLDGETGLLLPPDPSVDDLVSAVGAMTPERALAMRAACEARAALFTRERFLAGMRAVIAYARASKAERPFT